MKKRIIWLVIPALALCFAACDSKKQETKAPEVLPAVADQPAQPAQPDQPAPPEVPEAPPIVKVPEMSADERAAKLGFVKYLPQETEMVMAFHNGTKSAARIESSKFWKLMQSQMDMGAMIPGEAEELEEELPLPEVEQDADTAAEPEPIPEDTDPVGPATLFGTEFTVALGKSTVEQTGHLLTANRRSSYFQMRGLAKAFVEVAKSGDLSGLQDAMISQFSGDYMKDLLTDKESGVDLFEKMKMPPLYFAFRTSSSDRDAAAQQLASLTENIGMIGEEIVESIEVEKAGQQFAGKKISGAKIAESLKEDRDTLDAMMDTASADRVIASISKKDIIVLSGTIGDYVVLFIGSSVDDLVFAPNVTNSMAANDSFKFSDAYASKELAAVIYGEKNMLDTMIATAGGLSDMAAGLRDGLAGSDGLGDTRDLETLLRMVGERESALRKMASNDTLGLVAFFEEGLKIETFGGTDNGALDWKSPNKLASLGNGEDVVMFLNMTENAVYDEASRDYMEALLEATYAMAMKVADLPMEDEQMVQFKEMTKMFDGKFRSDVIAMWDAFSADFGSSLGHESAMVVDLSGSMPAIPGVPQSVVDEAKFPRISMIAPVTDRAMLSTSWEKMNSGTTRLLAKVSEMTGEDMPMQKPISSENNGSTTWFFPMPFFNDDFMPSVTVGDQWFAASSSKNQALDLIEKATKGGESRTGLYFAMNFKALQKFMEETRKMLEKNKDAMPIEADMLDKIAKATEAMDDLDELTLHSRREAGVLRSSIHFKTR